MLTERHAPFVATLASIAVLAAGTTLLVGSAGESALLLYLAIGLGVATAIPMLLPDAAMFL